MAKNIPVLHLFFLEANCDFGNKKGKLDSVEGSKRKERVEWQADDNSPHTTQKRPTTSNTTTCPHQAAPLLSFLFQKGVMLLLAEE